MEEDTFEVVSKNEEIIINCIEDFGKYIENDKELSKVNYLKFLTIFRPLKKQFLFF